MSPNTRFSRVPKCLANCHAHCKFSVSNDFYKDYLGNGVHDLKLRTNSNDLLPFDPNQGCRNTDSSIVHISLIQTFM